MKPSTSTVDASLREAWIRIAQSDEMAAALSRYNRLAARLGQKSSVSADEIVMALRNDMTFARTPSWKAAMFPRGEHPALTRFWIQGNPLTRFGERAARHELAHLGAALRNQGDTVLHEIAVQLATTPEVLIAGGAAALTPAGVIAYYGLKKK